MNLTLDKIKKSMEVLHIEILPVCKPIFHFSPYVDDIYFGEGIDKLMKIKDPTFNSEYHQGFLVPMRYKVILEKRFGIKDIGD